MEEAGDLAQSWREAARREQCAFHSSWGHRVAWTGVAVAQKESLQLAIALHLYHKVPAHDGQTAQHLGLSRQELATVRVISNKIAKYFPDQEQLVYVKVLRISAFWRGSEWEECVFRVEGGGGVKFVDQRFRVYPDWDAFLKANTMQPCELCFPTGGRYQLAPSGLEVLVSFATSPASTDLNRALAKANLVAYLLIFVGLVIDVVGAFLPDLPILYIVGSSIALVAVVFILVLAIWKFFDALKYS